MTLVTSRGVKHDFGNFEWLYNGYDYGYYYGYCYYD
jgi:hypothetical protein